MTDMIYVEPELIDSLSGPVKTGYDCAFYYWSANKHSCFIVWRSKEDRQLGIRASIRTDRTENGYAYTITAPANIKPRPITGTETTLDAAKIAVNGHLSRIIATEFKEEYIQPYG